MNPIPLSQQEKSFILEKGDKTLLEIIKGMSLIELKNFDIYKPIDFKHYHSIQINWINTERYLISHRDGFYKEISEEELIQDMEKNNNPQRFRVFYVLKYPSMVVRIDENNI